MAKDYKPTWQGGLWEQENGSQPMPPPVNVPTKPSPYIPVEQPVAKLSTKAKVGFAGLLTLIFSLVCLSIVLGVRSFQGDSGGDLPKIFDFGTIEIDPQEAEKKPPSIRKASWNEEVTMEITSDTSDKILTPQEIYQKNLPSIVFIEAMSLQKASTGTGVIMSSDGYIITNAHVIESATNASVTLWNDETYDARLVGYDFAQDLAVLKIEAEGLEAAQFGDSDLLEVGDPSYALGNPLGEKYRSTFTDGMVAATHRVLEVEGNKLVLIQTTTAINSGNSGGALINQYGQVVGITTIKIMSEQDTIEGMGFAIPTIRVKQIVDKLIADQEIQAGEIGIQVSQVTEPVRGVRIEGFTYEESYILDAGIRKGDVIIGANGREVKTLSDLELVKCYLLAGDTIEYEIYRDGDVIFITAELEVFD